MERRPSISRLSPARSAADTRHRPSPTQCRLEQGFPGYSLPMIDQDPRLEKGAYITDGTDLYEVVALERRPGVAGIRTLRVVVENCRNFRGFEFLPDRVQSTFALVRNAPVGRCPDLVEEIGW